MLRRPGRCVEGRSDVEQAKEAYKAASGKEKSEALAWFTACGTQLESKKKDLREVQKLVLPAKQRVDNLRYRCKYFIHTSKMSCVFAQIKIVLYFSCAKVGSSIEFTK